MKRSITMLCNVLIFLSSTSHTFAQTGTREASSAINQKLAIEIQNVIDVLDPYIDADKVQRLNRTKALVESHPNRSPDKNLDQAVQKIFYDEKDSQWIKNLIQGWRVSLRLISPEQVEQWGSLPGETRISRVKFEPIFYLAGPEIPHYTDAYLTLEIQPQFQTERFALRISNPADSGLYIFMGDGFLLSQPSVSVESYLLDVSSLGPLYDQMLCEISTGPSPVNEEQFVPQQSVLLTPSHCVYFVPSGVADEAPALMQAETGDGEVEIYDVDGLRMVRRGRDLPNIDLDASRFYPTPPSDFHPDGTPRKIRDRKVPDSARSGLPPSDINACWPAATANSMYWLGKKHPEMAKLSKDLRANLELLKRLMRMDEKRDGVVVSDFIKGKLSFVDSLKLPIKVKYQSVHKAANPETPLKSEVYPYSTATNYGKEGVYPDVGWLMNEIDDGEDVELSFGYYYPAEKGGLRRQGGHAVVVDGYVAEGKTVNIYYKDDPDQDKPGGQRTNVASWAKDTKGRPILKKSTGKIKGFSNLKRAALGQKVAADEIWPIRIVESVTSESFDPSVSYTEPASMIPQPWDDIDLTDVRMKPGYPFVDNAPFPWLPVVGGVVAVGIGTYLLVYNGEDEEPCTFSVTFQTTNSTCGQANGSATIIPSPADEYNYEWSTGDTGPTISNVPAGTYSITVIRGGTDCGRVTQAVVVNTNTSFEASITTQDSDCDAQTGTATVAVTPEGDYTYQWSNGSTSKDLTNLAAGNYTLTISAGGECIQVYSAQIGEKPFDVSISYTTTSASCGMNDGTITATVDPPGSYQYAWSNGSSGPTISELAAGSYTLTVSVSGTTCIQESSVQLDELPAAFTLTTSSTDASCGLSDGTASVVVDPPGTYTYVWSNGQTESSISNLPSGTYQVTVSIPGTNCVKDASVSVGALPFPYDVTFDIVSAKCGTPDGSATAVVTPQGEFGYQWSDGSTMQTLSGVNAGTYQLTVTDLSSSCSAVLTTTIDELPADFNFNFTTTPAGCGEANGSVTLVVDPAGTYVYQWSNGSTTADLVNVPAGSYTVTATLFGTTCSDSASVMVDQTGITFSVTTSTTNADCGVANGTATATVDPVGEYQYQWSNNQSGPVLSNAGAGVYTLTVSDNQSCMSVTEITIGENPAAYIDLTGVTPGDCVSGGEITFNLTTPSSGPMEVVVTGPEGSTTLILAPGTYLLSSFLNVIPGAYSLTVTDQTISGHCRDSIATVVDDNSPLPDVTDDFFTTPGGQAITENALVNDNGLSLIMTSVFNTFGGTVTFDDDGTFTFIPDLGFSGEASFEYTVTDACGNMATGLVTIFVEAINCDFEAEFTSIPASCGLEDGTVSVQINPSGNYDYVWSNGDSGPVIANVFAGTYSVTVTDVNLGCTLEFTTDVTELPVMHIEDVVLFQPDCSTPGDIQFTATSNSMNPLVMIIDHPNGSDLFFIEPELILLSDYISITPGEYSITVFDAEAGADCADMVTVTLDTPQGIEIIAEAIIPPTEPTAMDGIAIIVVIVPGVLPYEILLNGDSWGVAIDNTFPVGGLGPGEYTIQIIDATGCASNVLTVLIPFPGLNLMIGTSIISSTFYDSNVEPIALPEPRHLWRSMLTASMQYNIGTIRQEVKLGYAIPFAGAPGVVEASYLSDITRYSIRGVGLSLQGGLGCHFEKSMNALDVKSSQANYVLLRANTGYTIARKVRLQASIECRGWRYIERPRVEFGVSIPLVNVSKGER
jgi:hypothetical protein